MKRGLLIVFSALIVSVLAATAFTNPDKPPKRDPTVLSDVAMHREGFHIGVVLSEVTEDQKKDLKITSGVKVEDVLPDSPAQKGGIKEGDIILKVDGKEVSSQKELRRFLRDLEESKDLSVELLRNGKPMTVTVVPEKRTLPLLGHFGGAYIGVQLQKLDQNLASYFQVHPEDGVLITRVEPDSPAEKAGIQSGDVVTRFNGKKVSDPEELRSELKDVKESDSAEITLLRHGKEQKVTVKPEKRDFPDMKSFRDLPEIPSMKELKELPEFQQSMDQLKREMEKLKREMKNLKLEDIQKMNEELKQELEKLKNEMEKLKNSD